jgi:hypothetical protein
MVGTGAGPSFGAGCAGLSLAPSSANNSQGTGLFFVICFPPWSPHFFEDALYILLIMGLSIHPAQQLAQHYFAKRWAGKDFRVFA